jgi:energy-coupling factor transport system permease protein
MESSATYEPRQSIIHQLDPRLKVLYPFIIGVLSVLLNWDFVFLLFGFTIIPWILMRTSQARLRVVSTMVVTPAIGLIWSQGLFHVQDYLHPNLIFVFPPTISWFGTPGLSGTGLLYGAQQAGRVMAGASASLILLMTTRPSEVIWAFYKFRMPAAVGLAFTAALRFLPQMIERMTVLLQVMQVRGYDLTIPRWWQLYQWPGYISRVFMCIPIVTVPLLISSLRSTSVMAMVADARAFGSNPKRTMLIEHQITLADCVAIFLLLALIFTVLILLVFHIGNRQI